jgi:hypothetical protein
MGKEPLLLETEGVDGPQVCGLDTGPRETQVLLHGIRQADVHIREAPSQTLRDIADTLGVLLARWVRHHPDRLRRRAGEIGTELVDQHIAAGPLACLGEACVRREVQAQPNLDQLEQLGQRILLQQGPVLGVGRQPLGQQHLALGAAEQGVEHRSHLSALAEEGDDIVIGDGGGPQHLVDLPVGEPLAQHVEPQPPELRLVAGSGPLQLHQHRALPILGNARQIQDQGVRLVGRHDRLDRRAQTEEAAFVAGEKGGAGADRHTRQRTAIEQLQLTVEKGREFAARVVEHDHRAFAQQVVQVLAEVVVERMHGPDGARPEG